MRRSAIEKDVVEAIGKVFISVVEVATNVLAVTLSVNTPAPVTEKAVPGEPVAMPIRLPTESTCNVPASISRLPVIVDVPAPLTVIRFETSNDVVDATGNVLMSVAEVEMCELARTEPVNDPAPVTPRAVPGVVVPIPVLVDPSFMRMTKAGEVEP